MFYVDGRDEIVLVPMFWGLTSAISNEYDRTGRMTRFVAHMDFVEVGAAWGVGPWRGPVRVHHPQPGRGGSLFGIGQWPKSLALARTCVIRAVASTRARFVSGWV